MLPINWATVTLRSGAENISAPSTPDSFCGPGTCSYNALGQRNHCGLAARLCIVTLNDRNLSGGFPGRTPQYCTSTVACPEFCCASATVHWSTSEASMEMTATRIEGNSIVGIGRAPNKLWSANVKMRLLRAETCVP